MNPCPDVTSPTQVPTSRRDWLKRSGTGLGLLGLGGLLAEETGASPPDPRPSRTEAMPLAAKSPHHKASARSVVHLFMNG